MCGGGGSQPAPVTPAPAPNPAEAPPEETEIDAAAKNQESLVFPGKKPGEYTRYDRSTSGGVQGGAGSGTPGAKSGITM